MKNIKYIGMAMLAVVLATVNSACTDNQNDWDVNSAANGNRTWGPMDLGVEKGDTCLKIFKFTATNATGYVAQVSTVNFDSAATADVKEYQIGKIGSSDSVTLGGLSPKTEYYLRVKACCEGKEDSQWLQYCKDGVYTVKTAALASMSFAITFDSYVGKSAATGDLPSYFHDGAFTLYLTDGGSKMKVTSSTKEFDGKSFASRFQTGAKSSETNSMRLHFSNNGTLTIYPFAGSSSKTSDLILTQNGTELLKVDEVAGSGSGKPYTIEVKAGNVYITYPTNSVNFYGFEFSVADGETYVEDVVDEQKKDDPVPSEEEAMTFTAFAAGDNPLSWTTTSMTLTAVDIDGKMSCDASTKKFDDGSSFTTRLKSGAASSEGVNELSLTFTKAGKLTVYPYAGSSSKTSDFYIIQDDNTLLSVEALVGSSTGTAYTVSVKAGTVVLSYPTNSVNFYGFKFVAD